MSHFTHIPPENSSSQFHSQKKTAHRRCIRWEGQGTYSSRAFRRPPPVRIADSSSSHTEEIPTAKHWAEHLSRGIVEVLSGIRPVEQLQRCVCPPLYDYLHQLAPHHKTRTRHRLCKVSSVRTCEPREDVVEATCIVTHRSSTRVVALRLEKLEGRWIATALDIV
ncbi:MULTISPECIES: Rv3235 family protein [unclassified Schaalia]|uniref:Rv3235 family protein n=1 Tax=unclassified Schaalia TaxID=2691889 RepID=UPI001E43BEAB|nr:MULTISPECIES: Rv3235 family protein [unclassified Schaalia]MCD4549889.1 Rv3235 family protein [Schaalia sp. lx-260]MCD4556905.1 Rv3235 family protein [Schaalia sp. lx-100]